MSEPRENRMDFDALLQSDRSLQSAYDKKISQALNTARANWEQDHRQAQELLRQELETEFQTRLQEQGAVLAEQERVFRDRMCRVAAAEALQSQGIDAALAPWIVGADEEETRQRAEQFTQIFRQALSQAVACRMRGGEPPREPRTAPELTRESLRHMSAREINRNWGQVAGLLRTSGR